MRLLELTIVGLVVPFIGMAQTGPYHPAATVNGTNAIGYQSQSIEAWATGIDINRGRQDISIAGSPLASFGTDNAALGIADASVVSLGDGGVATLTFADPISNRPGYDIAVFENAFYDQQEKKYFLELATVSVSSDGVNFFSFQPHSLVDTAVQIGSFGTIDPTYINNLAGKYESGQGTPFDLEELNGITGLDIMNVTHVRVTDVVGSIDPAWATYDTAGNPINDPFPTDFGSSGFDLDAVAIVNQNTGIESNSIPHWLIFNSLQGQFYIQTTEDVELSIYSLTGESVMQKSLQSGEYYIPHTISNTGIYIVHVTSNRESYATKCVIRY
jgi:hypothetical protein